MIHKLFKLWREVIFTSSGAQRVVKHKKRVVIVARGQPYAFFRNVQV